MRGGDATPSVCGWPARSLKESGNCTSAATNGGGGDRTAAPRAGWSPIGIEKTFIKSNVCRLDGAGECVWTRAESRAETLFWWR